MNDDDENERVLCWENTVLFLVSCYQYLILGVVYSKGLPYRQPFYTNGKRFFRGYFQNNFFDYFSLKFFFIFFYFFLIFFRFYRFINFVCGNFDCIHYDACVAAAIIFIGYF